MFKQLVLAAAACFVFTSSHATQPAPETSNYLPQIDAYVHMPKGKKIPYRMHPVYDSTVKFDGPIEVSGILRVYWYDKVVDMESDLAEGEVGDENTPTKLITEKTLAIEMYPDVNGLKSLPFVLKNTDPIKLPTPLALNTQTYDPEFKPSLTFPKPRTQDELRKALEGLLPKKLIDLIINKDEGFEMTGTVTLSAFHIEYVCDGTYFEAQASSFKARTAAKAFKATPRETGCGG